MFWTIPTEWGPLLDSGQHRFEVLCNLGKGGFSRVFACHDNNRGEIVAIKVCPKLFVKRESSWKRNDMLREYEFTRKMDHPHIVRIHEYIEFTCPAVEFSEGKKDHGDTEVRVLVMERITGLTFDMHMKVNNKMSMEQTRRFIHQLGSALTYIHANGIIFADMSRRNVIINSDGDVKLIDFGLSISFKEAKTTRKTICGTPMCISPEMVRGEEYCVTPKIDLWGLAVLAIEAYEGKSPFFFKRDFGIPSVSEIYTRIKSFMYECTTDFGKEIASIVLTDRSNRPSMDEFLHHPSISKGNVHTMSLRSTRNISKGLSHGRPNQD